jgi:Zn finger protein HypA/HybF involved in hydrogenase expression
MNKRPVPRGNCKDCKAAFALHRAIRRISEPLLNDEEFEIYTCPECGSYAVEEEHLETQN